MTEAPLSYGQQLLAAFAANDGGSVFGPKYLCWAARRLTGAVDVADLQRALDDVVVRQTALRTVVVRDEGFPFQRVLPAQPVPLVVIDLDAATPAERRDAVALLTADWLTREYPSDRVPLMAAYLVRFGPVESALVLIIHRSVADGWTMKLAIRDIMAGYERRRRGLPPDPSPVLQYVDCARVDASPAREERIRAALPYWEKTLADFDVVGLSTDHPRIPSTTPVPKAMHSFAVGDATVEAVRATGRALRTSFFTVLLTAYSVCVRARTGADEVIVPALGSGRERHQWDTIGYFLNGYVLRLDLSGDPTLAELVARVHRVWVAAQVNDVPFVRVLEALPQVAEAAFDLESVVPAPAQLCMPIPVFDDPTASVHYAQLMLPPELVRETPVLPIDFVWMMEPYEPFMVRVMYNPRLFDEGTITALEADFHRVLRVLVDSPQTTVRSVLSMMDVRG
ncbi:MAG TPA: condensation domain-containing protein [Micromonosporaceae bacterium]|jgi:hypothetical protein|nr:condensation domain-containing protein [Micromonosporaceae bacterium]